MKVKLLFFGRLASIVTDYNEIELVDKSSAYNLKKQLLEKYPSLKKYTYRMAVNEELINEDILLHENDVVAFMPPFAGG